MARQRGEDMTAEERRQRMARQIRKIEEESRSLLAPYDVARVVRALVSAESELRLATLRDDELRSIGYQDVKVDLDRSFTTIGVIAERRAREWPLAIPVDGSHDYPEQPRPSAPSGPIRAEEDGLGPAA